MVYMVNIIPAKRQHHSIYFVSMLTSVFISKHHCVKYSLTELIKHSYRILYSRETIKTSNYSTKRNCWHCIRLCGFWVMKSFKHSRVKVVCCCHLGDLLTKLNKNTIRVGEVARKSGKSIGIESRRGFLHHGSQYVEWFHHPGWWVQL